jgi:hypothetical protein
VANKKGATHERNSFIVKEVGREGFEPSYTYVSRFTVCRL